MRRHIGIANFILKIFLSVKYIYYFFSVQQILKNIMKDEMYHFALNQITEESTVVRPLTL